MNAPVGLEIDNAMYINNDPFFQTVYARVFNAAGCFAVVPLNLVILNTPMPNDTPEPFELCDDDTDGLAVFDLTTQEAQILDGLDPAVFTVTWFVDQTAADAGTPVIPDPTSHISNTNTVVAVVTDVAQSTTTFCSAFVTLDLIVNPLPTPIQPALFELCDDLDSGSDIDEFSTFDLRSRDDEITGGNDDWVVSYHLTLITLTLVVNPLPSPTTIAPVEECDDDDDGVAVFDLTDPLVSAAIINGEAFVTLSFHETLAAAELGVPSIATPAAYASMSRTIYVRAMDTDPTTATACFRIIELELVVNPIPPISLPLPDLTECNDGTDQVLFDDVLPIADPVNYLVTAPGVVVWVRLENIATGCGSVASFNTTIAPIPVFTAPPAILEACDSEGPDVGPDDDGVTTFDLTVLDAVITAIFIQISSTAAGMCMAQTTIDLIVNPLPFIAEPLPASIACDDDNDGFGEFDLQMYNDDLLASLTDIDLRFYETFDNAQLDDGTGLLDITIPYNNITGMAQLYIVAEDTNTGCTKIYSFDLLVFPMPDLMVVQITVLR